MLVHLVGDRCRDLVAHFVLSRLGLHFTGDDRQDAVAEFPDILRDQDEADAAGDHRYQPREHAADDALTDPGRQIAELPADDQNGRACDPARRLLDDGPGRRLRRRLVGIDGQALPGVASQRFRHRCAVARADEGPEAVEQRRRRVHACDFDRLADLAGNTCRQVLDRDLDGVGTVDALGDAGRELLRHLIVGQGLQPLRPARFLLDVLDRQVDAAVDHPVEIGSPPLVGNERLVVDRAGALAQGIGRNADDRLPQAAVVAGLAGLIAAARHFGRQGRRQQTCDVGRYDQYGDNGTRASHQCRDILAARPAGFDDARH